MESMADFVLSREGNQVMVVKGYAGTGKTSIISALVRTLEELSHKTLLLAPTGRSAKVFSSYAGRPAFTIHKKIYRQRSAKDIMGRFVLAPNLLRDTTFLVDEASMISNSRSEDAFFGSGRLLDDLITFVRQGVRCKLVLIGDTAQLPPVGTLMSPALDLSFMAGYFEQRREEILTDIVRQTYDSGILHNATIVRNMICSGNPGPFRLAYRHFKDVHFINGGEMTEVLEEAYRHFGVEETVVICRSNRKANQYNAGIRRQVLFREEELNKGDLLMVVRNNYHWLPEKQEADFIANGDIFRVAAILDHADRFGFRFAYLKLQQLDHTSGFECWILLDTLMTEQAALGREDMLRLFNAVAEDYSHLKSRAKISLAVREDPFFNALQVKYAFAVTCHKAQGGQWKAVLVDQGHVNPLQPDMEYLRWLYTAVTRATDELYMVNFPADLVE